MLVTDRRLGSHTLDWPGAGRADGAPPAAAGSTDPAAEADFTVIEIRLDGKGTGEGKTSLMEVLATIITQEIGRDQLMPRATAVGVPCEYIYVLARALKRDRDARTKDVATMYDQLKSIMEGRVQVECPVTLTKRATSGAMRWVDRHPYAFMALAFSGMLTMIAGLVSLAINAVNALS